VNSSKRVYRALLICKWVRSHKTKTRGCFTVERSGEGRGGEGGCTSVLAF
jgi:hypothetical protein